jgi:hypothetical protein
VSALGLRIPNPVRQQMAGVPAESGHTRQKGRFRPDRGVAFFRRFRKASFGELGSSVTFVQQIAKIGLFAGGMASRFIVFATARDTHDP